jgi:hypothetical protein
MRIPYGRVQGSGYNACTGKYCIICPGAQKKKKNKKKIICTFKQNKLIVAQTAFDRERKDS